MDAIELDPNVPQLLRGEFRDFAGGLYDRPEVCLHRADARAFVQAAHENWNIIDLSLVDSFAASAVGAGAVGENYLYTREAFEVFLRHLRPGGVLAVTRWARTPPRDELKLFATGVAALERMGLNPTERLVLIRSWAAATLLVKKEAFTAQELSALRQWAEERLFDTAYFPGITPDQHNRFNVLERDYYFEAAAAFLAGSESRDQFFRDYVLNLRPSTDDRPYFFHFFRWRALPLMPTRRTHMSRRFLVLSCAVICMMAGCSYAKRGSSFSGYSGSSKMAVAFAASPQRYVAERHKLDIITPESDLQKAWESTIAHCATIKCELVSSSITTRTEDSAPAGMISLRVVPDDVNNLLAFVEKLGKIAQHTTERQE